MNGEWMPSRGEQRLLFWLRRIMRYGVGGGGLIWAMVTDHLEPVLLFVLGAVATSTDILKFAADLFKAAKEEEKVLERTIERRSEELKK